MIDIEQYRKRVARLYSHDRDRWRAKLQSKAPHGVKLCIAPDQVLPYTQRDLEKWMWSQIQLQAILCIYCSAPIDILSLQLDHKTPLRRGGGPDLDNKQIMCARCNRSKGQFTHEEYLLIVEFMRGPAAYFRQRLESVLSMGNSNMNFPGKGKGKPKVERRHTQDSLYFSNAANELGDF